MGTSVTLTQAREWICGRARGATLEIGVGSGLNLPHYSPDVSVTGIDRNGRALRAAHRRSRLTRSQVTLIEADALALPFPDRSFDTVVATFAMCGVRDVDSALAEALRVLRPGGSLLLADHVRAQSDAWRAIQRIADWVAVPLTGEHFSRRPLDNVNARATASGDVDVQQTWRPSGWLEAIHAVKR